MKQLKHKKKKEIYFIENVYIYVISFFLGHIRPSTFRKCSMHWTQSSPPTISFVMAEATSLCDLSLLGLSIKKKKKKAVLVYLWIGRH